MQLEFKNVSYSYSKKEEILKNINFKLEEGITVLCGKNGSGKSTLINLINFIYEFKDGDILIDEIKYNKKQKISYRTKIATVYQFSDIELFNLTVEEDLLYAVKVQKKDLIKAKEDIKKYFKVFSLEEEILNTSPFKLSGGQKKKIAIISALILNPQILILDEPLIGLDNKSKKQLLEIINNLKSKMKIVIVLHNYDYIYKVADNIVELKENTIVLNTIKEDFFKEKYENDKVEQLTSILKICKILKLDFVQAKKFKEKDLIGYVKDNYVLH